MNKEIVRAILAGWHALSWRYWQDGNVEIIKGFGQVQVVEHVVPEEESWNPYIIFKIVNIDNVTTFYRKYGVFYSYDGVNWDGSFESVKPIEKTVITYEYVLDD